MADTKDLKKFRGGIRLDASTDTAPTNPEVGAMYVDTNGTLKIYNGSAWDSVGSGAGTTNYINTAESKGDSIAGFNTYADAAAVTPVDGTAGTATTGMLSQDTSTKLRGVNSVKLLKKASTAEQGMGISYDFTIDKADKAKKMIISFDYMEGTSGDYTDGDARVFIYDKDNSKLIRVNGEDIKANTGMATHYAQFQTAADSDDYRLIIHIADAGNGATHDWELFLDNISVAPQTITHGTVTTDWTEYTPTITGFSTATNVKFFWKRLGDEMKIRGYFTSGTPESGTDATIQLPSGYVFDTGKVGSNEAWQFGQFHGLDGTDFYTGTAQSGLLHYYSGSTNKMYMSNASANDTTIGSHRGNAIVTNSGESLLVEAQVPIAGWSSNTRMSEDFSGRDVVFIAEDSSGYSILQADQTIVDWGTVTTDTTNSYEADTTGYYTIPETGYYDISASVSFTNTSALDEGEKIYIRLLGTGGTEIAAGGTYELQSSPSGSSYYNTDFHKLIHLDKGYQIAIGVYQNSGGTLNLESTAQANYVSIAKRQSAQTILENETVACRVTKDDVQSVAHATTVPIRYDDVDYDTHGAYHLTDDKYTVPITGYYDIYAKMRWEDIEETPGMNFQIYILVGGVNKSQISDEASATNTTSRSLQIQDTLLLNKGDEVTIAVYHTDGSAEGTMGQATDMVFTIKKIK